MATTNTNGRLTRKSLASEIDRLDSLLEGLAENLNEAVATAVREAVGLAVHEAVNAVVQELLTNPELVRSLQPEPTPVQATPAPAPNRSLKTLRHAWNWTRAAVARKASEATTLVGQVKSWVGGKVQQACATMSQRGQQLVGKGRQACATVTELAPVVWRCRKPLVVALAVGLVLGVGCYIAGPFVAATVSGLAGFAGSLTVSAVAQLGRLLTMDRVANT